MTKPRRKKNESIDAYNERASKLYYANGYHIKEIAEKLKIDKIEVYNYVANGPKITTEAEREEMISLFNKGYSYSSIAKIFNRSRACIKDRIESPAKINCGCNSDLTDKQLKKMKELANEGKCIKDIAREIGVRDRSIEYRLSHTDVGVNRRFTYVTPAEVKKFVRLYKNGKSHNEIAKTCNRSRSTVLKYLHKAGCWRSKEK